MPVIVGHVSKYVDEKLHDEYLRYAMARKATSNQGNAKRLE